eukprot:scaffold34818_cov68-Phaeocystis_antarctica.AAC.1
MLRRCYPARVRSRQGFSLGPNLRGGKYGSPWLDNKINVRTAIDKSCSRDKIADEDLVQAVEAGVAVERRQSLHRAGRQQPCEAVREHLQVGADVRLAPRPWYDRCARLQRPPHRQYGCRVWHALSGHRDAAREPCQLWVLPQLGLVGASVGLQQDAVLCAEGAQLAPLQQWVELQLQHRWRLDREEGLHLPGREVGHADGPHQPLALELHQRPPRVQPHRGVCGIVQLVGGVGERPVQQVEVEVGYLEAAQRRQECEARLRRAAHAHGTRHGAARRRVERAEVTVLRGKLTEQCGRRRRGAPVAHLAAEEERLAVHAAAAHRTADERLVLVELAHVEQRVARADGRGDDRLVVVAAAGAQAEDGHVRPAAAQHHPRACAQAVRARAQQPGPRVHRDELVGRLAARRMRHRRHVATAAERAPRAAIAVDLRRGANAMWQLVGTGPAAPC